MPMSQPSLGGNPTRDKRRAQSPRNCVLASVPRKEPTNTDSDYRTDVGHMQWELNTGICLDMSILG